jgi:riboflavin synthase alpha subunit
VTTLSSKQQGAAVNIEVDITAKYVEKLISWKVSEEQADEVTS